MCSLKYNLNVLFWEHNKSFKHNNIVPNIGRGWKPLIWVRGSRSHQSKTLMEGRKDKATIRKKPVYQF